MIFAILTGIPAISYLILMFYAVIVSTFFERLTGTVLIEYLVILVCVTFATILIIIKKKLTKSPE